MPSFIAAEMRRTTRELLIANGVLLLILAGAALASTRYLHNFFAGPFPSDLAQLAGVTKLDDVELRFVTVAGERNFDTGYHETSVRRTKSGTVTTVRRFSLLVAGDRALVVKSTRGAVTTPVCTGELVALPDATRRGVETALARTKTPQPLRLLSVELDTADYRAAGFLLLGIGVPLALLATWNLVRGARRWRDPSCHPIVREVERYGDFVELATAIEVELAGEVVKVGPFRITSSWLLRSIACRLDVVKLDDVLWAMRRPGRHPALEIRSRRRPRLWAPLPRSQAELLLGELAQRIPWVAFDGSREWRTLWKQGADAFARVIDERRRNLANEAVSSAAPAPELSTPSR